MESTLKIRSPRLLDQVKEVIRRKHYSIRTERTYADWVKRYILFHHKRHPKDLGKTEITEFLNHLAIDRKVAASTQNQALSALVFLYKEVLDQEILGHKDVSTTMVYTHVIKKGGKGVRSPVDELNLMGSGMEQFN